MPCITHVLSFHHRQYHIIDTKKSSVPWCSVWNKPFRFILETIHHLASSCTTFNHIALSCIILHHLASSCIVLHHLALPRILLHHLAASCIVLHYLASSCIVLHHLASSCTVLHCLALSCIILQNLASSCIVLHCLASSCKILQHLALSCIILHTETPRNTTHLEDIGLPIPAILQTSSVHISIWMFKEVRYHDAVYNTCSFISSQKIPQKKPGTMMQCMK